MGVAGGYVEVVVGGSREGYCETQAACNGPWIRRHRNGTRNNNRRSMGLSSDAADVNVDHSSAAR